MNKFASSILLADISTFPEYKDLYYNLYAKVLLVIGMPITALFSVYHVIDSRYIEGGLVFVIFLSLCGLFYDLVKQPTVGTAGFFREAVVRSFLFFFVLSQWYDVHVDENLSSTPWFMIFPVLFFFSTRIKEALVWCSCIGGILCYSLFVADLPTTPNEIFQFKTRLVLIFGIMAAIALVISMVVRTVMQKLFDNAKTTKAINVTLSKEIEEHQQTEKTLRQNQEIFRLLAENANDVIWTMDMDLHYKYISPAIEKIQGWNAEEASSLVLQDVLPPRSIKIAHKRIEAALAQGARTGNYDRSERLELELYRKDGTLLWADISASFILDEDGKPSGILGVTRDITARKNLEDQLLQARKMESIGTLAGGIAHDFNNLLMGIQGRASLIELDIPSSDHAHGEHIQAIREYVVSATGLTKQLLGFARGGKYDVKPVDINELLLTTAAMFGRTSKQLRIRTKTDPTQPVVEADRSQIEQVLLNMFVNSRQAMPGGGELILETMRVAFDDGAGTPHGIEPGHYVKIGVTDTGIGMDTDTQQKIFDPFFTTKDKSRGTGMGLASAYGIVTNHGGMITVNSTVDHGTTFAIYLPASEKRVKKEAVAYEEMVRGSETILVVDDEEMIREVGKAMVQKLGYQVLVATSGEKALEAIANPNQRIDLVLLDLIMPDMDGGQTFDRIRELQPQIPVMLSSGYALDGQAAEIMNRGCDGFIQKPFNLSELSKKIRNILDAG